MKIALLFFLLLFFHVSAAQPLPIQHIIVIGIDGLASKDINESPTPVMDSLMKNGSFTLSALSLDKTVSSPNWASIIMGTTPQEHEITSNEWKRQDIKNKSYCGGSKGETYPTIFKIIRNQYPSADLACFHDWDDFGRLVEKNIPTYIKDGKGEDSTLAEACRYISINKPLFTFIHLDHVDHAGHTHGWYTPEYVSAVSKADQMIGLVLSTLQKTGIADVSTIFIVSDHGGIGKKHGGTTQEEHMVPFIAYGKGIAKANELKMKVTNADVSPTIGRLLNCKIPDCWTGNIIQAVFPTQK